MQQAQPASSHNKAAIHPKDKANGRFHKILPLAKSSFHREDAPGASFHHHANRRSGID